MENKRKASIAGTAENRSLEAGMISDYRMRAPGKSAWATLQVK